MVIFSQLSTIVACFSALDFFAYKGPVDDTPKQNNDFHIPRNNNEASHTNKFSFSSLFVVFSFFIYFLFFYFVETKNILLISIQCIGMPSGFIKNWEKKKKKRKEEMPSRV